jgi:hypothetical protein
MRPLIGFLPIEVWLTPVRPISSLSFYNFCGYLMDQASSENPKKSGMYNQWVHPMDVYVVLSQNSNLM